MPFVGNLASYVEGRRLSDPTLRPPPPYRTIGYSYTCRIYVF